MDYDVTIGLELHVQLRTRSKMFCACPTIFGEPPNTNVCPVCMGYPGVLPVMNEAAVLLTVKTGLMLGCEICAYSKFDRKNYFYPDMPKNYQVSQYDLPLCLGGGVDIATDAGVKRIGITRIHLEEDVGKLVHFETTSGVDFNRAGIPLMEIVSEPELASPDEAFRYLAALKQILQYGEVSDCNMEEGNIRCDANISIRPRGAADLGVKTEIKNLNTFHGVQRALEFEVRRQHFVVDSGGTVTQETRRWDDDRDATFPMRTKEYAHDYRYFPEPDLLPVALGGERIDAVRATVPELPASRKARFRSDYGLSEYDAGVLVAERALAEYFEAAVEVASGADDAAGAPKAVANYVINDLLRELASRGDGLGSCPVKPAWIAQLVGLVDSGRISSQMAKDLFVDMYESRREPAALVRERGLEQVTDEDEILGFVRRAVEENSKVVADYRGGKANALKFLVGQVMRLSRGKANPQRVNELLRATLDG